MNVLNLEHISKVYGDKVIFDDISCGIHQGDKIGIIGINGTGKTTFLRILAGLEEADEGQVITQNGLRITYLPQHPQFPEGATILSYVTQGRRNRAGIRRQRHIWFSTNWGSKTMKKRLNISPVVRKSVWRCINSGKEKACSCKA